MKKNMNENAMETEENDNDMIPETIVKTNKEGKSAKIY